MDFDDCGVPIVRPTIPWNGGDRVSDMYARDWFSTHEGPTGLRPRSYKEIPNFMPACTGGNDRTRYRLYGTFKQFLDWGVPDHHTFGVVLYRYSGLVNDRRRWGTTA